MKRNIEVQLDAFVSAKTPRKSVLIVDDNKSCIAILAKTLTSWGMSVNSAISGEEALAFLQDHTSDLALIDCQLACMDGISLARAIRVRCPECIMPVIMLTSIGNVQEGTEELGILATILKPVKNRHLKKALIKVCKTLLLLNFVKQIILTNVL